MKIGIIGALDSEIKLLLDSIDSRRRETVKYGLTFHKGYIDENEVVIVKCGVGKVNAARCAQILIDVFNVGCVINTGVAGAIDDSLDVGDVIVPDSFIQHDFDLTYLGYAKGYMCTGNDSDIPTKYYPSSYLNSILEREVMKVTGRPTIKGTLATGDIFISNDNMKKKINDRFAAVATEMESAAIAQVCSLSGVPFAALRTISDKADNNSFNDYGDFKVDTSKKASEIVLSFVKSLR